MSGRDASSNTGGRGQPKTSRSKKAGLQFPVGRIARSLKDGKYADRIAAGSPVYLAAVLEYLTVEVLEQAGDEARNANRNRITPNHILKAIRYDEELHKLLKDATIAGAGVAPPKSNDEKDKASGSGSQQD